MFTESDVYLLYPRNKYFSELEVVLGRDVTRRLGPDEVDTNFLHIPVAWPMRRSPAACP